MIFNKITVRSGENTPYHSHPKARQAWYIVSGEGYVLVEGERRDARPDKVFYFAPMQQHQVLARTDMVIIEVSSAEDTDIITTRGFNGKL